MLPVQLESGIHPPQSGTGLADKSGETMDWFTDVLAESGIDFRHEIDEKHEGDNYEVLDVGHSTQYGEEYSEQLTMDAVLKHAEADGLEVQYEITMVKLEKDGDRVTGSSPRMPTMNMCATTLPRA